MTAAVAACGISTSPPYRAKRNPDADERPLLRVSACTGPIPVHPDRSTVTASPLYTVLVAALPSRTRTVSNCEIAAELALRGHQVVVADEVEGLYRWVDCAGTVVTPPPHLDELWASEHRRVWNQQVLQTVLDRGRDAAVPLWLIGIADNMTALRGQFDLTVLLAEGEEACTRPASDPRAVTGALVPGSWRYTATDWQRALDALRGQAEIVINTNRPVGEVVADMVHAVQTITAEVFTM